MIVLLGLCLVSCCMSPPNTQANWYPSDGQSVDQICRNVTIHSPGWIVIDPVGERHAGEVFLLTATTNLVPGTNVTVRTWPITDNLVNRSEASGEVGTSFHTHVMQGNNGGNVINGVIDSRKFRPESYLVVLSNDSAGVSACTWYNVSIAPEETPALPPSQPATEPAFAIGRNLTRPWIAFDPVPDTCIGDTITVSGTTNLPAGENITSWIYEARYKCTKCPRMKNDSVDGCCGDRIPLAVKVRLGKDGINSWSREINTSAYDFRSGEYTVDAGEPSPGVLNSSGFSIPDIPDSSRPWISVAPVPLLYPGEIIAFHGTTNLPPGETLRIAVYSAEFAPCPKSTVTCSGNVSPCCGGYSAEVSVRAEPCGINSWSWEVSTREHGFRPGGEYAITASGRNGAVENTRIFTLSGIPRPNLTLNIPLNNPDGRSILLSGQVNTGNGPDENLQLNISMDSGRKAGYLVSPVKDGTGYSWSFSLNKSAIMPYNFLTVNVSSRTSPEISVQRTFLHNNEPVFYPYDPVSP